MLEAGEYYLEIDDAAIELKKIGKLTIQNRTIKIQLDDIVVHEKFPGYQADFF